MFSVRELSAAEQSFESCRRKYLQKQGGVRDMQANEIGDVDVAISLCWDSRMTEGRY
jgi:hypothetical protein